MAELICPDCKHPTDSHAFDGCQVSAATGEWDRNWRNPCHCKWNRQTAEAYAYAAQMKQERDDLQVKCTSMELCVRDGIQIITENAESMNSQVNLWITLAQDLISDYEVVKDHDY